MVEWVIDLVFVQMVGRVVDFDFELALEIVDYLEEFDWIGVGIVVEDEDRMVNIVDIEHKPQKDFSILDSKIVIVVEPKAAKMDFSYFVKTEKIVVVSRLVVDLVGSFAMVS